MQIPIKDICTHCIAQVLRAGSAQPARADSLCCAGQAAQRKKPGLGLSSGGAGDLLGGLLSNLGTGLLAVVAVHLEQLGQVELGGAQDLHLPDRRVLQRVDALCGLLNLLACNPQNGPPSAHPLKMSPA